MRDVDVIDQELRLLAVVRAAVRREGARLSPTVIDELLDERLANRACHQSSVATIRP